ncbi:FadR/GntR family transcriptional regulator [Nocardioides sp. BP30]|uniref:FadR/GntR family transcriptional regulator n=1 Tax=Nocardioides sp. BP30 TaxID=3036374 RepID=UPI002469453F|nr:FadR/GntR family transcriptional regulator [Nocardioides sp. BP30]WGL50546.1 FadR/GntR family transcriptional regulator [Nocardioides sp. BP30]
MPAESDRRLVVTERRSPTPMLGVAVVEDLVDAIVSGRLEPGTLLPPEGPLSEQFGVSRTVIRESVKRVEEKGLVTIARGRGTQVRPTSSWNMLDRTVLTSLIKHDDSLGVLDELSVIRAQLESVMAAEAARVRDADQLARLDAALRRMRETVDDQTAFRHADIEFHEVVMATSGNRLAESIARILMERALESWRYHGVDTADAFALTLSEHAAIHAAITEQDAVRAQDAMNGHIVESWRRRRLPDHAGKPTA